MGVSIQTAQSFPIDGAPATPVLAGTIMVPSGANAGNAKVSGAKAVGVLGILSANSDRLGYGNIATQPGLIVDVIAGSAVVIGNIIASDGSGRGVPVTPTNGGGTATQFVGIAITAQPTVGQTFKMLYQPFVYES